MRGTPTTNFNVLDNHSGAEELWLRSGFQWDITNNISLRSQVYGYDAIATGSITRSVVRRSRVRTTCSTVNVLRSITPETLRQQHRPRRSTRTSAGWKTGSWRPLRRAANNLTFRRIRCSFQTTSILINPDRGLHGPRSDEKIYTHLDNASPRLRTGWRSRRPSRLIGGIRFEDIELSRTRFSLAGVLRSDRDIRSQRPSIP